MTLFFLLNHWNSKEWLIRKVEIALGKKTLDISKSSKKNLNSRRSIYVAKNLKKGETITKDNIKVVRPSFGLHPKYFEYIIGKKVNRKLNFGERFKLSYISEKK